MRRFDEDQTTHILPRNLTRRRLLQAAGLTIAGTAVYSCEFARHAIEHIALPVAIRNLPEAFHDFRIVQISDIHFEDFTERFFLDRVIREVNALAPDLILITGDFITHGPPRRIPEQAIYVIAEALGGLTCSQRIACMGNHDSAVGTDFVARILRDHGTTVLINQYLPIERNGDRLWIGGVEDPATSSPDLSLATPRNPGAPLILMAHAPDYADDVLRHPDGGKVDLILSGHSHGGQIRLPFVGPLVLPSMGRKYVHGHFQFGPMQLYVNRGLGAVSVPFRFNCPPEITTITLHPA
jgi:predicted MPP superfamily phosphohydrolase